MSASDAMEATGTSTPAFRRLWSAWAASLFGDGVRGAALPLYVAVTTNDPLAASAVFAAEVLPWLLFALPAGALVDRWNPRRVVIAAHLYRATLTFGLVAALIANQASVPIIALFAFLLTVGETFAYSASQSLLVQVAGRDDLERANAQFYAAHTVGLNLVGPLVGGLLVVANPEVAFALNALTFAIAAALIASLPSRAHVASQSPLNLMGIVKDVQSGLSILWNNIGLRTLVVTVAFGTFALGAVNAQTALFAVRDLGMDPRLVPILIVSSAVATLIATRVVPALSTRLADGAVMVGGLTLIGFGMISFGLSGNIISAVASYIIMGLGLGAFNVLAAARRQRLTPDSAMGRLSGAYRMVAWGLTPVGAALAGPLAVATSLGIMFVIFGIIVLIVLVATSKFLLRPAVSQST